jgi:4-amino-4-deoxychorismate lyase
MFFETIKCYNGIAYNLQYHQARVDKTFKQFYKLDSFFKLDSIINSIPSNELLRCKIIYNNSHYEIEYFPYKKKEITSLTIVEDNSITYDFKYTNRDNINSLKQNYQEVIIVKNGLICDTSIANIALYKNNKWLTPKKPLLQGTTRARLLKEGHLIEADLKIDDLFNAQKIGLMNAMTDFYVLNSILIKRKK